jgi:hypothetical protein
MSENFKPRQTPKVTITVEVLKITASAILVKLPTYSNLEVWFPNYYATDLKKDKVTGKSTIIVPQWILTAKLEGAILKIKKGHAVNRSIGSQIKVWKDDLTSAYVYKRYLAGEGHE